MARRVHPGTTAAVAALAATALTGCGGSGGTGDSASGGRTGIGSSDSSAPPSTPQVAADSGLRPSAAAEPPRKPRTARVAPSDGRARRATLSIPALDIRDVVVAPYVGRTDDADGTRIQDGGVAASPHGPEGGVGPGGIGNYQVTAHRTSAGAPFARLPALRPGGLVTVRAGGTRYVYEIRRTRQTSFRSARSLAEQRAAVPGRPGATPTRAYLTLSTCATPEDHAAGNYWADEFHNPEHRIDKIGVLVRTGSATGSSGAG